MVVLWSSCGSVGTSVVHTNRCSDLDFTFKYAAPLIICTTQMATMNFNLG